MAYRDHTKVVKIGDRLIGGGNPILIQSMTNTRTEDVKATVEQIHRLEQAGCEIIRCTVPTPEAARAVAEIKKQISIPLVADIHFDYKMAIAAMENGADKIRINPGNIGGKDRIAEVVRCARERQIPIRVGVNSGSLEKNLVEKYGGVTAEGLVESALDKVGMVEDCGYDPDVLGRYRMSNAVRKTKGKRPEDFPDKPLPKSKMRDFDENSDKRAMKQMQLEMKRMHQEIEFLKKIMATGVGRYRIRG